MTSTPSECSVNSSSPSACSLLESRLSKLPTATTCHWSAVPHCSVLHTVRKYFSRCWNRIKFAFFTGPDLNSFRLHYGSARHCCQWHRFHPHYYGCSALRDPVSLYRHPRRNHRKRLLLRWLWYQGRCSQRSMHCVGYATTHVSALAPSRWAICNSIIKTDW